MCFACEQEQMLAAYRDYVARRKALTGAQAEGSTPAAAGGEGAGDDWAKGTWFAALAAERDP